MQSLGKVPSARRPPANLPSLKAEVSTPTDQSGSTTWVGPDSNQLSTTASAVATTIITQTVAAPIVGISATNNSSGSSLAVNNLQTVTASSIGQTSTNSSNSISNTLVLSSLNQSHNTSSNSTSSSASATWSSIATGAIVEIAQPPIYQSPQFQHEFPSLDGSGAQSASKSNRDRGADAHHHHHHHQQQQHGGVGGGNISHQMIDGQMSLRPQNDVASWMQQQQTGNRGVGVSDNGILQENQQVQDLQQMPPQFRAVMPEFMYRTSAMNSGSGGVTSGSGVGNFGGGGGTGIMMTNTNTLNQYGLPSAQSGNTMNYSQQPIQVKQRQQTGQSQQQSNQHYMDEYGSSAYRRDERSGGGERVSPMQQRRGGSAMPAIRQSRSAHDNSSYADVNEDAPPTVIPVLQRPIIKEEELDRMDSLARDDGWTKSEEIDYNQKLVFSDDEDNAKEHNSKSEKKASSAKEQQQQKHQQEEDNRAGEQ